MLVGYFSLTQQCWMPEDPPQGFCDDCGSEDARHQVNGSGSDDYACTACLIENYVSCVCCKDYFKTDAAPCCPFSEVG